MSPRGCVPESHGCVPGSIQPTLFDGTHSNAAPLGRTATSGQMGQIYPETGGDTSGTDWDTSKQQSVPHLTRDNTYFGTHGTDVALPSRVAYACKENFPGTPQSVPSVTLKDLKALAGHTTGRGTHATRCATCHQPILTGLDADRLAIQANIDWTPLDETGELQALLAGRRTYRLERQTGGNPKLTRRAAKHIRARRKRWQRYDIVPAHRCGSPPLATTGTRLTTTINLDPNQPCPF